MFGPAHNNNNNNNNKHAYGGTTDSFTHLTVLLVLTDQYLKIILINLNINLYGTNP